MTTPSKGASASPTAPRPLAEAAASLIQHDLLLAFDSETGAFLEASDTAMALLGLEGAAADTGRSFAEILAPEGEDGADLWWEVSSGTRKAWTGKLLPADGSSRPVSVLATQDDAEGAARRIVVAARELPPPPAPQETIWNTIEPALAVIEYDSDGNIVAANERAILALEYFGEDLVGKHHDALWPNHVTMTPEYAEFWEKLRQGRTIEGQHEHVTAMGGTAWMQSTFVPKRSAEGHVTGAVQCLMDVSDFVHKTASQGEIARALEAALGLAVYDAEGHLTRANEAYRELYGIDEANAVGMKHDRMVEPAFARGQAYTQAWAKAAEGEAQRLEVKHTNLEGRERWMEAIIAPVLNASEEVERYVHVGRDITDARIALTDLQDLTAAFERCRPLVEFDLAGALISSNRPFRDIFGVEQEEIGGTLHADWCDETFGQSRRHEEFWDKLVSGESIIGTFRRIAPNGREAWLHVTYVPVANPDGRITRIAASAIDVTRDRQKANADAGRISAIEERYAVAEYAMDGTIERANAP
ncbi:MAG: PAS domain-containing protein, partial [Pseudomonadota bacterium]